VRVWTILMRAPGGLVYLSWTHHAARGHAAVISTELNR
jgi:hypothetical protein